MGRHHSGARREEDRRHHQLDGQHRRAQKVIDFSDKYYDTTVSFFARKGEPFELSGSRPQGKVIGIQTPPRSRAGWRRHSRTFETKLYDTETTPMPTWRRPRGSRLADTVYIAEGFLKSEAARTSS
jgi:hypothetical protein